MTTDTALGELMNHTEELVRRYHWLVEELSAERARSAKLVKALEEIREWDGGYTSPLELRRWADEALATYRAGDGK